MITVVEGRWLCPSGKKVHDTSPYLGTAPPRQSLVSVYSVGMSWQGVKADQFPFHRSWSQISATSGYWSEDTRVEGRLESAKDFRNTNSAKESRNHRIELLYEAFHRQTLI